MKHTPGPWQCAVDTPGIRPTTRGVIAPRCENMLLATVYNPAGRIKEREANARLIAAAPELLDACVEAHQRGAHKTGKHNPGSAPGTCWLCAAIAKAMGD